MDRITPDECFDQIAKKCDEAGGKKFNKPDECTKGSKSDETSAGKKQKKAAKKQKKAAKKKEE